MVQGSAHNSNRPIGVPNPNRAAPPHKGTLPPPLVQAHTQDSPCPVHTLGVKGANDPSGAGSTDPHLSTVILMLPRYMSTRALRSTSTAPGSETSAACLKEHVER
jgi:hypothetical protein